MILVAGATGMVGREVCTRLAARGEQVRALVRPTSDTAKVEGIKALGAEVVAGDLRDPASLQVACRGVEAVITTVSSMPFSYQPGVNDIASTDVAGSLALVGAAKAAGVRHFVYISFSGGIDVPCPLASAKRSIEEAVAASGMRYTILRPSYFMDVWLSPAVGFDVAAGRAAIYGTGENPISWIAVADVAEFAVRSLETPVAWDATLELGGPEPLSPLEVVRIFEERTGTKFDLQFVPTEALEAQRAGAEDPMAKSFVSLQLAYAQGDPIEMGRTVASISLAQTSVAAFAEQAVASPRVSVG